jgi:hypothetical protein
MPAVMLTAGEHYSSPGIKNNTAGAFGMCAGNNMLTAGEHYSLPGIKFQKIQKYSKIF